MSENPASPGWILTGEGSFFFSNWQRQRPSRLKLTAESWLSDRALPLLHLQWQFASLRKRGYAKFIPKSLFPIGVYGRGWSIFWRDSTYEFYNSTTRPNERCDIHSDHISTESDYWPGLLARPSISGFIHLEIIWRISVEKLLSDRQKMATMPIAGLHCQVDLVRGGGGWSTVFGFLIPDRLLLFYGKNKPELLWEAHFILKPAQSDSRTSGSIQGDSGFNFRQPTVPQLKNRSFEQEIGPIRSTS